MSDQVKTRYTDEELDEFRQLILKKLERAKDERDFYLGQLKDLNESDATKVKGIDDGTGTAEMERLTTLASRTDKYVKHLDNALIRIENKVYGVCRETGNLISKDRLKAVPHATLSYDAKENRR